MSYQRKMFIIICLIISAILFWDSFRIRNNTKQIEKEMQKNISNVLFTSDDNFSGSIKTKKYEEEIVLSTLYRIIDRIKLNNYNCNNLNIIIFKISSQYNFNQKNLRDKFETYFNEQNNYLVNFPDAETFMSVTIYYAKENIDASEFQNSVMQIPNNIDSYFISNDNNEEEKIEGIVTDISILILNNAQDTKVLYSDFLSNITIFKSVKENIPVSNNEKSQNM